MSSQDERSAGFAPIDSDDARVLILGSLPSRRSIADEQYYAHPQNTFWRIMAELAGAVGPYADRCSALQQGGIALWDVLASSVRPGSLDADIQLSSAKVNDFQQFLATHGAIERICFNGQQAAKIFSARVPQNVVDSRIQLFTLPSTSPAHAAMRFEEKLEIWRDGLALSEKRN